jgi:hypothetical protein
MEWDTLLSGQRPESYQPRATPWIHHAMGLLLQANGLLHKVSWVRRALLDQTIFMPQSLSHVILHFVFSTKHRRPWLDPAVRPRLQADLATLCRDCARRAGTNNESPGGGAVRRRMNRAFRAERVLRLMNPGYCPGLA